ncbi:DUF4845 domain-containing protein [Massilia sp. TS11]|uniref:DUF4845 domain-containing protein n=1 Tax=Massilia sp. TS11 TaxID=2908003 RepID=UPI001ED9E08B|nr:DUF4845 domain-containing protein [Massilia sp. TS11]MCG2583389.1 DUF4845 domain-containing protein [Massilia sp. TS11]
MKRLNTMSQRGISLSGLIFGIIGLALLAILAMKVLPTVAEYRGIKDAIVLAKNTNGSVRDMQLAFDKQADINNISSITGKDLMITKDNGETDISFSYEKRIALFGNVSLVIAYEGTTAKSGVVAAKQE